MYFLYFRLLSYLIFGDNYNMSTREQQEKLKALLKEAVTLLCRSSLTFKEEISVEGLFGITIDNEDVFLVNLNEVICNQIEQSSPDSNTGNCVSKSKGRDSFNNHSRQQSTSSQSSRKRSLEVSDNSQHSDVSSKSQPPPLPVRQRRSEPPNKRRIQDSSSLDSSTNSNATVIIKSEEGDPNDPTYQTLSPPSPDEASTDPTHDNIADIFQNPGSLFGTPLASSTAWGNATTSTQVSCI